MIVVRKTMTQWSTRGRTIIRHGQALRASRERPLIDTFRQPVFGAPRASELRCFFGGTRRARKPQVSAEFCVKRSSAFCARLAKDRTRDNASLSAPKDTETHHDWRDH